MISIEEFENRISYGFKDKNLLIQALTHSSYANEKKRGAKDCNERLEFLGDAVLEIVVSEFLYLNLPDKPEGELSKLRASLVCEPTLAYCANEISLGDYVYLSNGENATGGRKRKSILSDALEAVIGAMYLDGGIEPARALIDKLILSDIDHKQLFFDSKTRLQEVLQKDHKKIPEYRLISEDGPDHAKHFVIEVCVQDKVIASGTGNSKKSAECRLACAHKA